MSVRGHSSASSVHLFYEVYFYHVLYAFGRKRSFVMFILEKQWVLFSFFKNIRLLILELELHQVRLDC